MGKCIICGKRTNNPSFCSKECVDVYDGEAPRGSYVSGDKREQENRPHSSEDNEGLGSKYAGHPGCG